MTRKRLPIKPTFRFPVALLTVALLALAQTLTTPSSRADDPPLGHATWAIRGCNYYPKDFPWGHGAMWTQCPPSVYAADCARMKAYGINTVRVFLPVISTPNQQWYRKDGTATENILHKIDLFLTACQGNGIRAIVCFDAEKPTIDSGGATIENAQNWFRSVITPRKTDARILAWDVINEPDADPDANKSWTPAMAAYVGTMFRFAKTLTDQPITVGMAWRGDELKSIGVTPDIYQFHEYSGGSKEQIRQTLQRVREQWPGKPVLVGEFGIDTKTRTEAQQNTTYKNVLDAVRDTGGIWGTCFWTLWDFPGVGGKEGAFGILRRDGHGKAALSTVLWYY